MRQGGAGCRLWARVPCVSLQGREGREGQGQSSRGWARWGRRAGPEGSTALLASQQMRTLALVAGLLDGVLNRIKEATLPQQAGDREVPLVRLQATQRPAKGFKVGGKVQWAEAVQ